MNAFHSTFTVSLMKQLTYNSLLDFNNTLLALWQWWHTALSSLFRPLFNYLCIWWLSHLHCYFGDCGTKQVPCDVDLKQNQIAVSAIQIKQWDLLGGSLHFEPKSSCSAKFFLECWFRDNKVFICWSFQFFLICVCYVPEAHLQVHGFHCWFLAFKFTVFVFQFLSAQTTNTVTAW